MRLKISYKYNLILEYFFLNVRFRPQNLLSRPWVTGKPAAVLRSAATERVEAGAVEVVEEEEGDESKGFGI